MGLREGRRGLRPRVRVLCDPVVPRPAAIAHDRVDRSPKRARSSTRASPRSCSSRKTSRGTDVTSASPVRWRRCCAASTRSRRTGWRASACSTSIRPRSKTRSSARCWSCRRSCPYFDLSLQHASAPLMRRMKRWGSGERFLPMIEGIRAQQPDAAFRSSFIVGFPGETESDHDQLLAFLAEARLDWAGFFAFSREDGTPGGDDGRRRRRAARSGAPRRVRRDPGSDHERRAPRPRGSDDRGARRRCRRRRRARRPHPPRGAGDRRRRAPRRRSARSRDVRPSGRDRARPRFAASSAPIWRRSPTST